MSISLFSPGLLPFFFINQQTHKRGYTNFQSHYFTIFDENPIEPNFWGKGPKNALIASMSQTHNPICMYFLYTKQHTRAFREIYAEGRARVNNKKKGCWDKNNSDKQ